MKLTARLRALDLSARVELAVAAAVLAAAAWPFWAGRYLPFLDLPQHLALAHVIAHAGDPAFSKYYEVDWRITPYWGYYGAMHVLQLVGLGPELANRVLFTGYAVALPLGAAAVLRALGRDWRWAALAAPFVFNTNLFFGFVEFACSLPLFLFALAASLRHFQSERLDGRAATEAAALAALVYLFHAQSYLLLGVGVIWLFFVHWRGLRWAVERAAPYVLSLALFAPWFLRSFVFPEAKPLAVSHTVRHENYGALSSGLHAKFEPLGTVVSTMAERVMGVFNDGSDGRLLVALLVLLLACVALAGRPARPGPPPRLRAALLEHRGEALAVIFLCTYLFAPMEIAGQWYINPRHLVFAALLAPAFVAAPATGFRRWLAGAAAALCLVGFANVASKVRAFQEQVGPFDEVMAKAEPGGRLMNLMFDNGGGGVSRLWPFVHWGCYYQVEEAGDVSFSFAGLPSIPVEYKPGMQAPHPYEWSPGDFRWDTMGPSYDWFLVRGNPWGDAARLGEHADLVARAGPWMLWRRR